jgi:hypothetical protein
MFGRVSVVRLFSVALLCACPLVTGCDNDDEAAFECSGSSTPAAQACCAYGQVVFDYCVRCNPNREEDCADTVASAIDVASFGEGCEGADGIRDPMLFYDECLPAVQEQDCSDSEPPESCQDQILYEL